MPKVTRQHSFVRYNGGGVLNISGLSWLAGNVLRIWSPSNSTGTSMQSFGVASNGGTLTQFQPGSGYWIHSSSTTPNWDLPSDFEIIFGVPTANVLPVVNAGSDITIQLPTSQVVLMGTASDPDGGTITTYAWTQTTGPNLAVLASANAQNTTASGLVAGVYQFRLTVTDDRNGTKADDVLVNVNGSAQIAAPTNGLASPVSITQLRMTGTSAASGGNGFRLYRSPTENGVYTQVGGTLASLMYLDSNLNPDVTYWYKWQAIAGSGGSDSSLASAQAFSGKTPAPRGTIEIRGGGATQSNFAGAAPRELMDGSYYIDSPRAYGLSIPRNAVEKWSLGTYNNGAPDQSTANDHGLFNYTMERTYGGVGPAAAFVPAWLANNAGNAKSLLFYTMDVAVPDNVNSTTTRWFEILLDKWKAEWVQMVTHLKALGWTGMRVILYHDLGEGNSMTPGELDNYYPDMLSLISQMETHVLSFAATNYSASVLGHGILWKQQNWGSNNIAADINPFQTQLVANVPKAFKVEMPNVDPVTSFQDQYGNGTRVHYTTEAILQLGAYMAAVENSLDIGVVFKEEFNSLASLGNNWTSNGFSGQPGTVEVTGGKLRITPAANTPGVNVTGFRTNNFFGFAGRRWILDITQLLTTQSGDVAICVQTQLGAAEVQLYLMIEAGNIFSFDGGNKVGTEVPYNVSTMRFIGIRATPTEILWQVSPDGIVWTTLQSKVIGGLQTQGFTLNQVYLSIFANTFASVPDPGTFVVESAKLEIV